MKGEGQREREHMYVHTYTCLYHLYADTYEVQKSNRFPQSRRYRRLPAIHWECQELNSGPLKEWRVLLTYWNYTHFQIYSQSFLNCSLSVLIFFMEIETFVQNITSSWYSTYKGVTRTAAEIQMIPAHTNRIFTFLKRIIFQDGEMAQQLGALRFFQGTCFSALT